MDYLRQHYKDCQVSEGATKLLLASWRQKSSKTYDLLFGKWVSWCGERDSDPVSYPIGEVINFLAHLLEQGYQYRSINSYHSAISSVHEKVDGYEVGQHPMVSRILKGIFHIRPPQPRYSETWDVLKVTAYIETRGDNDSLSFADSQDCDAPGIDQTIQISRSVSTGPEVQEIPPRGSDLPANQIG